eukprot:508150-Pleurochrysis_carterae.AAC.1
MRARNISRRIASHARARTHHALLPNFRSQGADEKPPPRTMESAFSDLTVRTSSHALTRVDS